MATSRYNSHGGGRGKEEWETITVLCPGLAAAQGHHCHATGRTHPSVGLWCVTGGRCPQGAVGARRKARRESCVPGQVLPAPCAFAPRFRLEPCRRHSRAKPDPKGPHGLQGFPLGTGDTQGQCQSGKVPCHGLGMLLGLIPNPRGVQRGTPEAVPQHWGPRHPGALLTLTGLLSCLRCFSRAFST